MAHNKAKREQAAAIAAQKKEDERRRFREKVAREHREKLEATRHAELLAALKSTVSPDQTPEPAKPIRKNYPKRDKSTLPDDPFSKLVAGRIPKRALPDLQELLAVDGMLEKFKAISRRVYVKKRTGPEIWKHPANIYMAVPEAGAERLFSTIEAARDHHKRHGTRKKS